ncbi:hypothetical protein [Rhodopseudomonas sp.]|uniref:hypothetical protein n=1 Tax=Rhodopseudomonas sp. TaxID=1078 RepID=UPI003B3BE393
MRDDLGAHHAAVEHALHGDGLAACHRVDIVAARPEIDQRPAAAVVENELVAEDLGDAAFHRDRLARLHLIDAGRLQQHHARRLPVLRQFHAARTSRGADGQNRECDAAQKAVTPVKAARGRRL